MTSTARISMASVAVLRATPMAVPAIPPTEWLPLARKPPSMLLILRFPPFGKLRPMAWSGPENLLR